MTIGRCTTTLPRRSEFNLSTAVAYLNAGAYGPLSRTSVDAGTQALRKRAAPWQFDKATAGADIEQAREAAAALIGAQPQDLAVITSVSHGASIAANMLPAEPGTRVLRLAGEHPSNVLPWVRMTARGCIEDIVPEPDNGDWTSAVLTAIDRPGAAPLAAAAFGPYHWSDGARLDLDRVIPAVRKAGGAVFLDATHAVGAEPLDVAAHRPDFVAFPLFKWLMGPYGMAFLYADPARQNGEPLDRSVTNSLLNTDLAWAGFAQGAKRYDRGERDDPVSAAIAASALAQMRSWGVIAVAAHLAPLGKALAEAAEAAGAIVLPEKLRAPHVLGLRFQDANRATQVVNTLAAHGVIVSERRGVVRVTPHVYNDSMDVECFAAALKDILTQ